MLAVAQLRSLKGMSGQTKSLKPLICIQNADAELRTSLPR